MHDFRRLPGKSISISFQEIAGELTYIRIDLCLGKSVFSFPKSILFIEVGHYYIVCNNPTIILIFFK